MNEWKSESCGDSLGEDGKIYRPNKYQQTCQITATEEKVSCLFGVIHNLAEPRGRLITAVSEGDFEAKMPLLSGGYLYGLLVKAN